MKERERPVERVTRECATWFNALGDAARIQIVSLLACRGMPTNMGETVAAGGTGRSTVSAHLKVLATVRFVLAEYHGAATCYRVNEAWVGCFPTAAGVIMGRAGRPSRAASRHHEHQERSRDRQRPPGHPQRARAGHRPHCDLARAVLAGGAIADCDPGALTAQKTLTQPARTRY